MSSRFLICIGNSPLMSCNSPCVGYFCIGFHEFKTNHVDAKKNTNIYIRNYPRVIQRGHFGILTKIFNIILPLEGEMKLQTVLGNIRLIPYYGVQ